MSIHLKPTAQGIYTKIPRDQIDKALDNAQLYVAMSNGSYQLCRRNGATKTWKRDPTRIYIPFKHGIYGYGQITEGHLLDGCLSPDLFRHADDLHIGKR